MTNGPSRLNDPVRFRPLFVSAVLPCLGAWERGTCRRVCRAWAAWLQTPAAAAPRDQAPETADDVTERLCDRLRALGLPWAASTEAYVRRTAERLGPRIEDVDGFADFLARLYSRSFLAPKTNINRPGTAGA